jgi:hypothetical protein
MATVAELEGATAARTGLMGSEVAGVPHAPRGLATVARGSGAGEIVEAGAITAPEEGAGVRNQRKPPTAPITVAAAAPTQSDRPDDPVAIELASGLRLAASRIGSIRITTPLPNL